MLIGDGGGRNDGCAVGGDWVWELRRTSDGGGGDGGWKKEVRMYRRGELRKNVHHGNDLCGIAVSARTTGNHSSGENTPIKWDQIHEPEAHYGGLMTV